MSDPKGEEPPVDASTDASAPDTAPAPAAEPQAREEYAEELRRGFCVRCFILSLAPVLLLLGLGWWATSAWWSSRDAEERRIADIREEVLDLQNSTDDLKASLKARQQELDRARAALSSGDKDGAEGLKARLDALPKARRGEVFDKLPELSGFREWFNGLSIEERRAWIGRIPGGVETLGPSDADAKKRPEPAKSTLEEAALRPEKRPTVAATMVSSAPAKPEEMLAQLAKLDEKQRDAVFAGLPSLPTFTGWLSAAPLARKAAFYQALPEIEKVPLRAADARRAPTSLAAADKRIAALETKLDAASTELEQAAEAASATRKKLKALETAKAAIETKAETAGKAQQAADREIKSLQAALAAAKSAAPDKKAEIARAKALADAQSARKAADAALKLAQKQRDEALNASKAATVAAAKLKDELEAVKVSLVKAVASKDDALTKASEAQKAHGDAMKALADARKQLKAAEARAAELAKEKDAAVKAATRDARAAKSAQAAMATRDKDLIAAKAAVKDAKNALTAAAKARDDALKQLAAARAAEKTLRAERDEAVSAATRLAGERITALGDAKKKIDALEARLAEAEKALAAAKKSAKPPSAPPVFTPKAAATSAPRTTTPPRAELRRSDDKKIAELSAQVADLEKQLAAAREGQRAAERKAAAALATATIPAKSSPDVAVLRGRVADRLKSVSPQRAIPDRLSLSASVAFSSGDAELSGRGKAALDRIATTLIDDLRRNPDTPWLLMIEGHTDKRPISNETFPSNWELSTARAAAVARYLAGRGVPAERLIAAGRAAFAPIDPADSPEAYRINRRIEFVLRAP
ncbi:MAG: OmpA family protein [Neomegalonema sp.]|nr:OmpA family protein [Neomegalonema sp.]